MVASLPRPQKVENTKGVNEANLTACTRSPYSCFFSSLCLRNKDAIWVVQLAGCVGMKNPNIKNALCRRPQKPLT